MADRQILIDHKRIESRKVYHFTKRVFDVLMSLLGWIVLSPAMAVIAYKIKKGRRRADFL